MLYVTWTDRHGKVRTERARTVDVSTDAFVDEIRLSTSSFVGGHVSVTALPGRARLVVRPISRRAVVVTTE